MRVDYSRIGNLSNYDMDFDEEDINGSEGKETEDDYDDDCDYAEKRRQDLEWDADHYYNY